MNSRPAWNTAPIRCGRNRCKWRGYEGDLVPERCKNWIRYVCPDCGCEDYMFMTAGEIKAWERRKAKGAMA